MSVAEWPEDGFGGWIGHEEIDRETISQPLVDRFLAVVPGQDPAAGLPLCLHWCLAPIAEPAENLGPDGHPRLGIHLPPIPLPRRMWAGGQLEFHDDLRLGDEVTRRSTIRSIVRKSGRTGTLVFVAVQHEFRTARGLAVDETQDLVYREPPEAAQQKPAETAPQPAGQPKLRIETDPTLLFRYSAITFNGHRIHYDRDYCLKEEGYPGLVVHGPLQGTLLMRLAVEKMGGRDLKEFHFRNFSPIFDTAPFTLAGRPEGADGCTVWVRGPNGELAVEATARF